MQILQAKCLQVNFQPYVIMEPNIHYYSGFTQVKEQAIHVLVKAWLMLSLRVS